MTKQQIGAELKRLRIEKGLSQKELAEQVGESFQHISHIEAGKYNLTLDRLERLCAAFGVSVTLIPGEAEKACLNTEKVRFEYRGIFEDGKIIPVDIPLNYDIEVEEIRSLPMDDFLTWDI